VNAENALLEPSAKRDGASALRAIRVDLAQLKLRNVAKYALQEPLQVPEDSQNAKIVLPGLTLSRVHPCV